MKSKASAPSRTTWIRFVGLFFRKAWRVSSTSLGLSSTSKISIMFSLIRDTLSESKAEGRSLIHFRFGPNAAAMTVDDALHGGQPHAGAFVVLGAVQALEDPEQFVGVAHIKAHAIVLHEIDGNAG